jgi:hypothetical protein
MPLGGIASRGRGIVAETENAFDPRRTYTAGSCHVLAARGDARPPRIAPRDRAKRRTR